MSGSAISQFANSAQTTITSGGTTAPASGTTETWTAALSSAFPTASPSATPPTKFGIADPAAPAELIAVTNVSGTTWTVTRGAEGTAPLAHAPGFTVRQAVSAGDYTAFRVPAWINVVSDYGADNTGATRADVAINVAIAAAPPGSTVYCPTGIYLLGRPIVIQGSVNLVGDHGCSASGDDAGSNFGTVFKISSGFTNPTWNAFATAGVLCLDQTPGGGGTTLGIRLEKFWVNGNGGAANVDGVALYGPVNAVQHEFIGVNKSTGNAFALYGDGSSFADGTHWLTCLAQNCSGHGFAGKMTDASLIDCHAQICGTSGTGNGFNITGGNNQLVGCRADLSQNGYYIAHLGGDGYDDYNVLTGCTTQRNKKNGLLLSNTSGTGTSYNMPVKLDGCAFTGDGTSSTTYAGVWVEGANQVELSGTSVRVYTIDVAGGCPNWALVTNTVGSGPGSPTFISWSGGFLGYAGSGPINDVANIGGSLRISPDVVTAAGYDPGTVTSRRGTATANGTTAVTVTNVWMTAASRVSLTWLVGSGNVAPVGIPYVASRAAGSFTIKSTSNSDTNTSVVWEILP